MPNELNNQLNVGGPNQVLCGDVTYISTGQRWGYFTLQSSLIYLKESRLVERYLDRLNVTYQSKH